MIQKIVAIVGSASVNSSNLSIVKYIASCLPSQIQFLIIDNLKSFPHFDPENSSANPPIEIQQFREQVAEADGVIICTPEYVFSIPSGLKNLLEWSVSTMIFSEKPVGLITASANGLKAHEELKLIVSTVGASLNDDTQLLIQGVKGKFSVEGQITNPETKLALDEFIKNFLGQN